MQFTNLFQPYELNFIQYRQILNLTLQASGFDTTVPYSTLPVVFETNNDIFLVPKDFLLQGTYYEFRQGFPYPDYVYYCPSVVVQTFGVNASFVSNVQWTSTNTSISISWDAPAYTIGILEYEIMVFVGHLGSAASGQQNSTMTTCSPEIIPTLISNFSTNILEPYVMIGCLSHSTDYAARCLVPNTLYTVQIIVVRELSDNDALPLSCTTQNAKPHFAPTVEILSVTYDTIVVLVGTLSDYYGQITQLVVLFVTSTTNQTSAFAVLAAFNTSTIFEASLVLLQPLTNYTIQVRSENSAGQSPYSNPVSVVTDPLPIPITLAPSIRVLGAGELPAGWMGGFLVTWRQPANIDPITITGYVLIDTGLIGVAGGDVVYSGNATKVDIKTIVGQLQVQTATIYGSGPFSVGTALTASSNNNVTVIVVPLAVCISVLIVIILAIVARRKYNFFAIHKALVADIKRRFPSEVVKALEKFNHGVFHVPRALSTDDLNFLDTIGEGGFGTVMKAILDESQSKGVPGFLVAVKMAKDDTSPDTIDDMRMEAALMAQFNHRNIVALIGQISEPGVFLIVLQYCEHESLLRWVTVSGHTVDSQTLVEMCVDVSCGMAYLVLLQIIHRDLAARNVLVASDLTCKIADFGLSRRGTHGLFDADARERIAIRWAAPETLSEHQFTSMSDVWSFAVLVYEVFSYGLLPYSTWDVRRVVEELHRGNRLEKPIVCPQEVYDVMLRCWFADPEQRPTFSEIKVELANIASVTLSLKHSAKSMDSNPMVQRINAARTVEAEYQQLRLMSGADSSRIDTTTRIDFDSRAVPHRRTLKDNIASWLSPNRLDRQTEARNASTTAQDGPLTAARHARLTSYAAVEGLNGQLFQAHDAINLPHALAPPDAAKPLPSEPLSEGSVHSLQILYTFHFCIADSDDEVTARLLGKRLSSMNGL